MLENDLTILDMALSEEITESSENYTIIEIAQKTYAIKTNDVLEIVKIMELEYPSNLPSCILGLTKFENQPVGVIDLREVIKIDRITYDLSAKIIIIKTKEGITAIICDKVTDITRLKKEKIHSLPFGQSNTFYDGIYIGKSKDIYILNIENIENYIKQNQDKFVNHNSCQLFFG